MLDASSEISKLGIAETVTPLWLRLMAHTECRLSVMREMNDNQSKDALETAFLRGKIAAYKEIRDLGDPGYLAGYDAPEQQ